MATPVQAGATQTEAIQPRSTLESSLDQCFIWVTQIFALAVAGILIWIAAQVAIDASPAIQKYGLGFLVNSSWDPVHDEYGVLPIIYGTIVSSAIALLFAVPIGVGTAIFLSENFIPSSIRAVLIFLVELLAAIPSIVYGLWGIFILIPFLRPIGNWLHDNLGWLPIFSTRYLGLGLFPVGIILTVMILPIITAISRDSLSSVDPSLRQASLGMGATRWTTIFRVMVPAAFSGIMGGIMLALGRALGETMAVTLLIGNSNRLTFSVLASSNTIASLLANQFNEASGLQLSALMYASLVLFFLTLIINITAQLIIQRVKSY